MPYRFNSYQKEGRVAFTDLRFSVSRLLSRQTRRRFLFILLVFACIAIWMGSPQLEGRSYEYLHRSTSSSLRQHLGIRRTNTHHDPRVWNGWEGINAIFAFGDSHTSTGFNPSGPQPDEHNPLGNPAWPGRTASYGPNYLGHLITTFRPHSHFVAAHNLATRESPFEAKVEAMGARDLRAPLSFGQQIEIKFLRRYGSSTGKRKESKEGWGRWGMEDTLFLVYDGMDDILEEWKKRGGGTNETAAELHIDTLRLGLEKLHAAGARNFLLLNYPSMEASPFARLSRIPNSLFDLGADIVHHNARLAFMAHRFALSHPSANVFLFDQHALSLAVRRNPKAFPETAMLERFEGFCYLYADAEEGKGGSGGQSGGQSIQGQRAGEATRDVFDALCGVGLEKFLWRDERHMTEGWQRLVARKITEVLDNGEARLPLEFW